ncbi:MAG: class I mannose-6-phosphate isomerase [Phycisphaerales bacterium]|jgi:mannose-6-phosphate isomerase|nr:class I mannose-6-phosphate isomerase [Phycisphaerales bacterium]
MLDAPLQLTPLLVPKVWGGRRLEGLGKALPPDEPIGESWELADLPGDGPSSVVSEGPFAGSSLRELLDTHQAAIMGAASMNQQGRFPLLIKFLDARANLSVQVHPDQAWADRHADAFLKSEAWVVLDAEPGSRIWAGVKPGTTPDALRRALDENRPEDVMQWRVAHSGSCHALPSGTCHALGAGVLVAEVQTTSDTTFRLWDWGRTGREMHVNAALACIDFDNPPPQEVPPPPVADGLAESMLSDTPWFQMRRVDCGEAATWRSDLGNKPMVLMCLRGTAHATGPGGAARLQAGSTALLPACLGQATAELAEGTSMLIATPV